MRLKNDHVVRLVGQFADLLSAFAVQGQLPGAGDYIENVLLYRRQLLTPKAPKEAACALPKVLAPSPP